jgi:hypothetical protein
MAGLETVRFVVDGRSYETTVLDAWAARGLYLQVVKAVAPALESLDLKTLEGKDAASAMLQLAGKVLAELDERLFERLCEKFGEVTSVVEPHGRVQLTPAAFGLHFAKRYSAMLSWVLACCKANGFFDFLSEIASRAAEAGASQSASESPKP